MAKVRRRVRDIVQDLKDLDEHVRATAAEEMCSAAECDVRRRDAIAAIEHLIVALSDGSEQVRSMAAWALANIGGPELLPALQPLVTLLLDDDLHVRGAGVNAIGSIGPDVPQALFAVPALIGALHDESEEVRADAAAAIEALKVNHPVVLRALKTKRKDPDEEVRSAAKEAFEVLNT